MEEDQRNLETRQKKTGGEVACIQSAIEAGNNKMSNMMGSILKLVFFIRPLEMVGDHFGG